MAQAEEKRLKNVLEQQNLGVLATKGEKYPYTSLVAFACTPEKDKIFFATGRDTKKFRNIKRDPHVTLLVDTTKNVSEDFKEAATVTALGEARECVPGKSEKAARKLLSRFSELESFLDSPGTALVQLDVEKYVIVTDFQKVREVKIQKQ